MKAAQITRYSKNIRIAVNDIPVPEIRDDEILIRVKAAAVNPVDILNLTGAVRLIQDYKMPLTLGNECAGIVEKAGRHVTRFQPGDRVYSRLPVSSLGAVPNRAFAEKNGLPLVKRLLFTLAGFKYDRAAKRQGKEYRFLFVRADGARLEWITELVEKNHIVPPTDPRIFEITQVNDAVKLVNDGRINGKVIVRFT